MDESEEVFEISDFTVATEWERFMSVLESIISEWDLGSKERRLLSRDELQMTEWQKQESDISLGDQRFRVIHYIAKDALDVRTQAPGVPGYLPFCTADIVFPGSDFCDPHPIPVVRWFGFQEFVALHPFCASDAIFTESRRNLVMSAVNIALSNCNCQVPVLLQLHKEWRQLYTGVALSQGARIGLDVVHLKTVPRKLTHLAGLLDVFKIKLACPVIPPPHIRLSISLCFELEESLETGWTHMPPDVDVTGSHSLVAIGYGELPFGACQDPIHKIRLHTSWSNIMEDMLVENDIYSDLNPLVAPRWDMEVSFVDHLKCLLSDLLRQFLKQFDEESVTISSVIGVAEQDFANPTSALNRLTEGPVIPGITRRFGGLVLGAAAEAAAHTPSPGGPIPPEDLQKVLYYIFPDAHDDGAVSPTASFSSFTANDGEPNKHRPESPVPGKAILVRASTSDGYDQEKHPGSADEAGGYPARKETAGEKTTTGKQATNDEANFMAGSELKSAPANSLTWRLSFALIHALNSMQGLKAFAHLWHEIVLELRYRWEKGVLLPLLEEGKPDLSCCSLHQDLQMLNCCIRHKLGKQSRSMKKDGDYPSSVGEEDTSHNTSSSSDWDEDVFLDCVEDPQTLYDKIPPEGRLGPCGDLKLLRLPGTLIYVPITQDPSPITESMLSEQASVLSQLGTTKDATLLRAKMQSASLLSDMQSFKAANPGCTLEDFVRWFSPRDWIQDGGGGGDDDDDDDAEKPKGHLSERMRVPGNMWQDVWDTARPIPAAKQKRLFDDTKEAEKILHSMASLTIGGLAQLLAPVLFAQSFAMLWKEASDISSIVSASFEQLTAKLNQASQILPTKYSYEECLSIVANIEAAVSRFRAMQARFEKYGSGSAADSAEPRRQNSAPPDIPSDHGERSPGTTGSRKQKKLTPQEMKQFLLKAMGGNPVEVKHGATGTLGAVLQRMFRDDDRVIQKQESIPQEQRKFPPPTVKEYILRCSMPRPATYSRLTPQRLYASVKDDEYRMAVAISEDVTFF